MSPICGEVLEVRLRGQASLVASPILLDAFRTGRVCVFA
jgi:hypothetical protein